MEKTSDEVRERDGLSIKYNNCAANGSCAICGGRTDPQIPLALFLRDTYDDVCDSCGEKHAPELYEMLRHFYAISGDRAEVNV